MTLAGSLDPAGSLRGATLEEGRDREAGIVFRPACSPGLAARTRRAATAWGPAVLATGRMEGC